MWSRKGRDMVKEEEKLRERERIKKTESYPPVQIIREREIYIVRR